MARERISLVPEEVQKKVSFRHQILNGQMNPEKFATLPPQDQAEVTKVLFEISDEKVNATVGASTLEFILFSFMRITNKKLAGMELTAEDKEIEASLANILAQHEMTDGVTPKANWLFDYMSYAEYQSSQFLKNRREHVQRKQQTIGQV